MDELVLLASSTYFSAGRHGTEYQLGPGYGTVPFRKPSVRLPRAREALAVAVASTRLEYELVHAFNVRRKLYIYYQTRL